jgi:HEAT repeat protein
VAPELIEPDERWSLSPLLEAWLALAPPTATAEVLRAFQSELRDAAEAALRGPPAATHVALALLSGVDPLLAASDAAAITPLLGTLRIALDELVKHPDPSVRAAAIVLLASATPQPSAAAVLAALEDGDEQVKVAALDQIWRGGAAPPPDALARVGSIALHDEHWWLRLRAVVALGRAGGEQAAASVLPEVLQHDSYAYVREAAAAALAASRAGNSAQALAAALVRDPEPRVRAAAARALQQWGGAEAERALRLMDAKTRELLQPGEQRN